ncbi:hypothetical protein BDP27DRAFT_1333561, partial [Rhodocollybia butyracea]
MSEATTITSQLYFGNLTSSHSPTCSSLESVYQALYTESLAKSRRNDFPDSPLARARLRALIAQTRSDLQTCSANTVHSQISRVLELQESLLAPIRTLPSDVLIDIFQLVIETSDEPGITYPSSKSLKSHKLAGYIFLLTWICFWWRDEALSYSAFWSRITFTYDLQRGRIRSRDAPVLNTEVIAFLIECILRSGASVPMSIEVFLRGDDTPPAIITTSLTMLVARSHRWRQAVLSFKDLYLVYTMFPSKLKLSPTHFPFLKDLSFRCSGGVSSTYSGKNPILECHPSLQNLELSIWTFRFIRRCYSESKLEGLEP